jgi:hypothetical protein
MITDTIFNTGVPPSYSIMLTNNVVAFWMTPGRFYENNEKSTINNPDAKSSDTGRRRVLSLITAPAGFAIELLL